MLAVIACTLLCMATAAPPKQAASPAVELLAQASTSSTPGTAERTRRSAVVNPAAYIGCYIDDGHRDLQDGPKRYGFTTATLPPHAPLQNGGWCVCGNAYASGNRGGGGGVF